MRLSHIAAAAGDPSMWGRIVHVTDARVAHVARRGGFWADDAAGGDEQVFVATGSALPVMAGSSGLRDGMGIAIHGVVQPVPPNVGDTASGVLLSADDRARLLRDGMLIAADSVRPRGRTP